MTEAEKKLELRKSIINKIIEFEAPEATGETIRVRKAFNGKKEDQNIKGLVISSNFNFALKVVNGVKSLERIEVGSWVSVDPEDFLEFGENIEVIGNVYYFDINCYRIKLVDGPDITRSASIWSLHDYRIHRDTKNMSDNLHKSMEAF